MTFPQIALFAIFGGVMVLLVSVPMLLVAWPLQG